MKKNVKAVISMAMVFALTVVTAGCSSNNDQNSDEMIKIGIVQPIEHGALQAAGNGFIDALADNGYVNDENIIIDYQNAQNDQSNLKTIAQRLASESDLVLAIATQAAQSMVVESQDIPILFTAVTDPVEAGIVDSMENPGANVTGTTDLVPIDGQINRIQEMFPDVQKLGFFYSSNEINSEIQVNMAEEAALALGMETQRAVVSNSNEISQVVQMLARDVDAIYIPTDNLLSSAMPTVAFAAESYQIPIFVGAESMVEDGGFACQGLNYYDLGYQTGEMAVRILKGEAEPGTTPVEAIKADTYLIINTEVAEMLGYEIPESLLADAVLYPEN